MEDTIHKVDVDVVGHVANSGLSPGELLICLQQRLDRNLGRTTLYDWRVHLKMPKGPYFERHIYLFSWYGSLLKAKITREEAKAKTIELAEHLGW